MSGGSFEYVYQYITDASDAFGRLHLICDIEQWLRSHNRHDAADEVAVYLLEMETHQRRVETIGKRISPLLKSVEWAASMDTTIEDVDQTYWKLMGMEPPAAPGVMQIPPDIPLKICPEDGSPMRRVFRQEVITTFHAGYTYDWVCPQCQLQLKGAVEYDKDGSLEAEYRKQYPKVDK